MPVISRFYGIIIKMYFRYSEHNPPHIHAVYGEYSALFSLDDCSVIEGDLPQKAESMVKEWMKLHQLELKEMWDNQVFKNIEPLL